MKQFKKFIWPTALAVATGSAAVFTVFALFASAVWAAGYNFYFNNVEQGANGTANPTLQVNGGKAQKTSPDQPGENGQAFTSGQNGSIVPVATAPAPATSTAPAASPASAPVAPVMTASSYPQEKASGEKFSRFKLGMFAIGNREPNYGNPENLGGSVSMTFYPLKGFGITALGGTLDKEMFYGGELDVIPIHISLFGLRDFIEVGGMLGATTMGRQSTEWGTVHGGARVGLNFGENYGLSAGVKTNLSDRSSVKYLLAEAGLTIRF